MRDECMYTYFYIHPLQIPSEPLPTTTEDLFHHYSAISLHNITPEIKGLADQLGGPCLICYIEGWYR